MAIQGIEQPALPRIRSVYDEDPTPIIIDGICTIGHTSYDISSVEYVIGDAFEIKPTPIAALDKPVRNAVILGEIYAFNKERNRTGEKFNLNYCITDGNSSIEIKLFNGSACYYHTVKSAVFYVVKGFVKRQHMLLRSVFR